MPPLISEQGLLDESYDSSEDEDFQVDDVREESDLSSSSELDDKETAAGPAKKKRRTGGKLDNQAPEANEEAFDSGDEATVRKAEEKKKRKRKGKGKGKKSTDGGDVDGEEGKDDIDDDVDVDFEDEEGGPGGFVKTRAMRSRMQEERKPLARVEGATVDVDALWEKMNDPNPEPVPLPSQTAKKDEEKEQKEKSIAAQEKGNREAVSRDKEVKPIQDEEDRRKQPQYPTEMIKIRRTYKFAGEISTEEKTVPKDSAEAKLFLANGGDAEAVTDADMEHAANVKAAMKLRRPLRRISRFDPNPTDSVKRSWEKQPVAETGAGAETTKGPKINTVEKSRLDWAAYVDQAGIKDELRTHSKAKEGYLNRMDFLDRMETKKEDERRNVRLRGL